MRNFMNKLKLDKANDGTQGGGGGGDSTSEKPPEGSENPNESEKTGNNVDDFGYETEPKNDDSSGEGKPEGGQEEKPNEDGKGDGEGDGKPDGSTGYGKPQEEKPGEGKPDEKPENKDGDEPSNDSLPDEEIKETLKNLPKAEGDAIGEFAKKHKLSKEVVEDYAQMREAENAEARKAYDEGIKAQRKAWDDDLRNDKEFGGENYDKNVMRAEKVLTELMPNTKKVLTEKGTMLPPYVMRDLGLIVHKAAFSTGKLPTGEAPTPKVEKNDGNFLDDFYQ